MRRKDRIDEILSKIKEKWILNPDMRLGQILTEFFHYPNENLFYIEDDKFGIEVFDPNLPNGFQEILEKFRQKIE